MNNSLLRIAVATTITISAVAIGFGGQSQPVFASKAGSESFVDKDLEKALKKHFERRFFNLIDADEKQKEDIGDLIDSQLNASRPLREKIKERASDLADMMSSESASDQEISEKVKEIRVLRESIQDKRLDTILKIRKRLSSEQKKVVAARLKGVLTGNPRLGLMGMQ